MKRRDNAVFVLVALLALPFVSGYTVDPKDVVYEGNEAFSKIRGFYIQDMAIPPHGKYDIHYNFTLISLRATEVDIQLSFNDIKEGCKKQIEGLYRNEIVYPFKRWSPKGEGEKLVISGVFAMKYEWEQCAWVNARLNLVSQDASVPSKYKSTELSYVWAKTVKNEITPASFPWTRKAEPAVTSNQPGWYTGHLSGGKTQHLYHTRFVIDGSGFAEEYKNPKYGIFPMDFRFKATDYFQEPCNISWRKGSLNIYSYPFDFDVGTLRYDKVAKKYYRYIEVVPLTEGIYTKVKFKRQFYMSSDGLRCTDKSPSSYNNYVKTNKLFLPPNPDASPRAYECRLVLDDFGESESDIFTYDFTVTRETNYFGRRGFSDYVISEVSNG